MSLANRAITWLPRPWRWPCCWRAACPGGCRATFTRGAPPRGVGLPLVVQILRAHGGAARFSNLPDGGCRATLYLPCKRKQGRRQVRGAGGPPGPAGGG